MIEVSTIVDGEVVSVEKLVGSSFEVEGGVFKLRVDFGDLFLNLVVGETEIRIRRVVPENRVVKPRVATQPGRRSSLRGEFAKRNPARNVKP